MPPSRSIVLAQLLLGLSPHAIAQGPVELQADHSGKDIIVEVINGEEGLPTLRAVWHDSDGDVRFELVPLVEDPPMIACDRAMEAAIGGYLDAHVHYTKQGLRADGDAPTMIGRMNSMTVAMLKSLGPDAQFAGFDQPTTEQLDRFIHIDWSKATSAIDAGSSEDKYLTIHFMVRAQRDELVRRLRADLSPLAGLHLGGIAPKPGRTAEVNTTCGTVFDDQDFLCALDLQLADSDGGGVDPKLGELMLKKVDQGDTPMVAPRIRKRDQWLKMELDAINDRLDRMDQRRELWELRDRMENMEDRFALVELDMQEVKDNTAGLRPDADNPLAELSDLTRQNLVVHFDRYSTALSDDVRVMLNEVFEQLARSPQDKVLITGYSDLSGDSANNLRLSEQRAKAVRAYLMQRGIGGDRLLVNFYGDSRSAGRAPDERRVEIEWLR